MKTIMVGGIKGGLGKTTTAISLAHVIAERGYRTLLVDLDPTARATIAVGATPVDDPRSSPLVHLPWANWLALRPGGWSTDHASVEELLDGLASEQGSLWDIRIIDVPPRIGGGLYAGVLSSELLIVPLPPAATVEPVLEAIEVAATSARPPRVRTVLSQVVSRWAITSKVREELQAISADSVYGTMIPLDGMAANAPRVCRPVTFTRPKAPASRAFRSLADEVLADLGLPSIREADA